MSIAAPLESVLGEESPFPFLFPGTFPRLRRRRPEIGFRTDSANAFVNESEAQVQAEAEALTALVRRAQAGEEAAQEALIGAYRKRLGGFVYGMVSAPSQVDDLCQTILVKMILSLDQLRDPSRFEAWFFKMARNRCLTWLRREKFRRLFSPLSDDHHEVAAPPAPETSEDLQHLRAALQKLPEKDRAILILVQERDSDYEHLSATLRISVGALKTRVHRAKLALKEKILHARNRTSLE